MGIQFIHQYVQAGLRDQIPLYSVFTVDETTLPALKDAAVGQFEARFWSADLKCPASEKYVADFRKKFGYTPSFYGAQSYDGILLIDSAVRAVKGNVKDTRAWWPRCARPNFKSIRGRLQVQQQPLPDPGLLPAEGGEGRQGARGRRP